MLEGRFIGLNCSDSYVESNLQIHSQLLGRLMRCKNEVWNTCKMLRGERHLLGRVELF